MLRIAVASSRKGTLLLRARAPKYARWGHACHKTLAPGTSMIRCLSGQTQGQEKGNGDTKGSELVKISQKNEIVTTKGSKMVIFFRSMVGSVTHAVCNPRETWAHIKKEAKHYYLGSKLLIVEVRIASGIVRRLLEGHGMTRRERMQLIRTTTDVFRVVPLSIFVLVPFMELALPFALKIFPNMLPSTFQEKYKKEEAMKSELQLRLGVASFFQETLREMAKKKRKAEDEEETGAASISAFIEKARLGEPLDNESVMKIAKHFKDELTLANINRPQLVSMCQYMGLPPYGADAFLRFQLRTRLRMIKEDDRRILWEGLDSLSVTELRDACRDRGMRGTDLSNLEYSYQLREWLDLSIQKNIPISLLIMSRAFMLTSPVVTSTKTEDVLKSSMSSLDSDLLNEVVLAASKGDEDLSMEMQERKLESLQFQEVMIEDEREDTDEAQQKAAGIKNKSELERQGNLALEEGETQEEAIQEAHEREAEAAQVSDSSVVVAAGDAAAATDKSAERIAHLISTDISKEELEERVSELSIQEMEVLADLARGSSVEREKAELAALEAGVEAAIAAAMKKQDSISKREAKVAEEDGQMRAKAAIAETEDGDSSTSRVTETSEEEQEEDEEEDTGKKVKDDKSMIAMTEVLNKMMTNIKGRIDVAEKELGENKQLPMLDLDGDGEISKEELKSAILGIFKKAPTDKEAEMMLEILDKDHDGKVSVAELLEYVAERRRKKDVEVLEADLKSASQSQDSAMGANVEKGYPEPRRERNNLDKQTRRGESHPL